jgi:hypothetical protein
MQHRALLQLHERRLRAVHRLQQQEVGDLGDAAAAGLRQARRERFAALMQQAADLAHVAVEDLVALRVHHRRDVLGVEHQLVVGPALDDAGHADGGIALAGVALEHQAQVQPADLDRGVAVDVGVAVADLDLGHGVARPHRPGRLLGVRLDDAGALQDEGENDALVARVGRGCRSPPARHRCRGSRTPCRRAGRPAPS